jgi:hypothetical protein
MGTGFKMRNLNGKARHRVAVGLAIIVGAA